MRKKNRKASKVRILLYLLIFACLAGIVYSGYRIYGIQTEYSKGERLYADIRNEVDVDRNIPGADGLPDEPRDDVKGPASSVPADQPEVAQANSAVVEGKAQALLPASQMDFEKLKGLNPDAVAWITIEGTEIDYPVVQGKDNEFYLEHLFSGEYGIAGSIFMEMTNTPDFSDQNTIIFGHHMNNGSMFANLDKYRSQKYYDEHPVMTLYTPQGDYLVEWFAGYAITAAPIPTVFGNDAAFEEYVEQAVRKSNFKTNVEVLQADQIITLCTCSYVSDDARYILVGVLK